MSDERRTVAVVTGAAGGIGSGIAKRLLDDGWRVMLSDVDPKVSELASMFNDQHGRPAASAWVADSLNEPEVADLVARTYQEMGRLDLAVANAGIGGAETHLVDMPAEAFDRIINIDLRGTFLLCREAGQIMRRARSGCIVTVSSIFGQDPPAKSGAYAAAKAGVIALTMSLALELAPFGVRANVISPGWIGTDSLWRQMTEYRVSSTEGSLQAHREEIQATLPLDRYGTPADIGAAVAFLASDDASYITGHTLGVNGGVLRR